MSIQRRDVLTVAGFCGAAVLLLGWACSRATDTTTRVAATTTADRLTRVFDAAAGAARLDAGMLAADPLASDRQLADWYAAHFISRLRGAPAVTMAGYGSAGGAYIAADRRQPDGRFAVGVCDPAGDRRLRIFMTGPDDRPDGPPLRVTSEPFDPRQRPWYIRGQEAHGLIWTNVYKFASDGTPGVDCCVAVRDPDRRTRGVVTVSIGLSRLGKELDVRPTTTLLVLLDQTGRVVGTSRPTATGPLLAPADESPRPAVRAAAQAIRNRPAGELEEVGFTIAGDDPEGGRFTATAIPVRVDPPLGWWVVAVDDDPPSPRIPFVAAMAVAVLAIVLIVRLQRKSQTAFR